MADVDETLKERLKKKRVPVDEVNKFLAYVRGAQQQEAANKAKKADAPTPVTNNNNDMLYTMFIKWWGLGLVIDGVNIVITGKAMSMVTFHGYKNKVRQTYPTAKFDVQLVRDGDTFSVKKADGRVNYTHEIGDAFSEKEIIGAYCVISIDGRDYFEALNKKDFTEMKNASKQGYLWLKWDSEFWLKSVIKRACKRHFYDQVKAIDEIDNADYGLTDEAMEHKHLPGSANTKTEMEERILEAKRRGVQPINGGGKPTAVAPQEGNVS